MIDKSILINVLEKIIDEMDERQLPKKTASLGILSIGKGKPDKEKLRQMLLDDEDEDEGEDNLKNKKRYI